MGSREEEDYEPAGLTSPPRRSVKRGSWMEDEDNTLGNYLQSSIRVYHEEDQDGREVRSSRRDGRNRESRRHSSMQGTTGSRRPQIQGPQPQPLQPSMLYTDASPTMSPHHDVPTGSNPRYLTSNGGPNGGYGPKSPGAYSHGGRYTPPQEEDEDYLEEERDHRLRNMNRTTAETSRSIMIAFDPSMHSDYSTPSSEGHPNIPNFPPPPPPPLPTQTRKYSADDRKNSYAASSKRAPASSFFSTNSYMAPTVREDPPDAYRHGSFASSHVIPSSWGSGPPGFWDGTDAERDSRQAYQQPQASPGYTMSEYSYDDYEGPGELVLVRQASLGKKSRATMVSTRTDREPMPKNSLRDSNYDMNPNRLSTVTVKPLALVGSRGVNWDQRQLDEKAIALDDIPTRLATPKATSPDQESIRSVRSMKLPFWKRLSKSSTRESLEAPAPTKGNRAVSPSPLNSLMAAYDQDNNEPLARPRPPRLDMDAVREAESRGSLTSLPDLIRRATKLAAVLETGRPDSRWGPGSGNTSLIGTESSSQLGRHTESISDILNSFPPPAAGINIKNARASAAWPLPQDLHNSPRSGNDQKRGRRVCGLPMWAFILLVLLGLAVVVAAIIVPIQLIALSKQNKSTALTTEICQTQLPCANGGTSFVVNGTACACECQNNWGGTTCNTVSDPTCATFIFGQGLTAEVGNGIPRVLNIGSSYHVPLNTSLLMAIFDSQNVTCVLQNAMISFLGRTTRIAQSTGSTSTASAGAAPSGVQTASDGSGFVLDEDVLDFSRVAVLYLVQVRGIDVAKLGNAALQSSFDDGVDYGQLPLGGSATIDMSTEKLNPGPGLTIVGGPIAVTTTSTSSGSAATTTSSSSGSATTKKARIRR